MSKLKVIPRVTRLINYIQEIEEGKLQIPSFQRDFIWGKKEKLELFESLRLGYPIGSLLFWKPEETFDTKDEIGPYKIKVNNKKNNDFFYILDGFQRLSTLFGCLVNPQKTNLEKNENDLQKEFSIYFDLENEEFTLSRSTPTEVTYIPVNTLIDTYEFLNFVEKLRNEINDSEKSTLLIDKARALSSAILDYQLPSIEIIGGTIEDAVDIFSRINSKGAKISPDWMVSALTYIDKDFTLGDEISTLLIDLKEYDFDEIKRDLVLQCIQNSYGKIYFDIKLTDITNNKQLFVKMARKTIDSIKKSVKFLFEELLVLESKLLPYNSQLIFITYFFNEIENPTKEQYKKLEDWFWITTYSNYFTIYSLSKQRLAFNQFKNFINGNSDNPVYNDKPDNPFLVTDFPENISFGSVRAKALVLFLLNYANDFEKVNSNEVDELKIFYLFKEQQKPEGVIPVIEFIPNESSKDFISNKPKDLSFLFERKDFINFSKKYFLTESMLDLYQKKEKSKILSLRRKLLMESEKLFVERLGLKYE